MPLTVAPVTPTDAVVNAKAVSAIGTIARFRDSFTGGNTVKVRVRVTGT